jgi:hypothetical protein
MVARRTIEGFTEQERLAEEMPPTPTMADSCYDAALAGREGADGACMRPAGHTGVHASHDYWGRDVPGGRKVRLREYWVRGN